MDKIKNYDVFEERLGLHYVVNNKWMLALNLACIPSALSLVDCSQGSTTHAFYLSYEQNPKFWKCNPFLSDSKNCKFSFPLLIPVLKRDKWLI